MNCDLVDADHAQDYGPCIYLLRMRDHYRWRNELTAYSDLDNPKVHQWILEREEYWEGIEGEPFQDILINGSRFDPFDIEQINRILRSDGLVYIGGLGFGLIPVFNLAEIFQIREMSEFTIIISEKEYARGIFGSPAMFKGKTIHVRKEALKQLLWGRYEDWLFAKLSNPTKKAFSFYDFEHNPQEALDKITETEVETLIQHEIGEGLLENEFGASWNEILTEFHHTKTEFYLRATRDLIADCSTTLPFLLNDHRLPSLYLYFASFSDMRSKLYPSLKKEFFTVAESANYKKYLNIVEEGKNFWLDIGRKALLLYQKEGKISQSKIDALFESVSDR